MGCGASSPQHVRDASPVVSSGNRAPPVPNTANVPRVIASRPLLASKSYRHGAPITQGELNNSRNTFWQTRTDGNRHMWAAIRSAAEALLAEDLPLASAIIEASNISCPEGTLEVCYDERGTQYKVPIYCYSHPTELTYGQVPSVSTETEESNNNTNKSNDTVAALPVNTTGGPSIKLRVRINPGDHNMNVNMELAGNILQLKQLVQSQIVQNIPSLGAVDVGRQRIIFMGRELQNNLKISEAKFDDAKVVQVFIRPKAQ